MSQAEELVAPLFAVSKVPSERLSQLLNQMIVIRDDTITLEVLPGHFEVDVCYEKQKFELLIHKEAVIYDLLVFLRIQGKLDPTQGMVIFADGMPKNGSVNIKSICEKMKEGEIPLLECMKDNYFG